jgi:hypothetical protein
MSLGSKDSRGTRREAFAHCDGRQSVPALIEAMKMHLLGQISHAFYKRI